MGKGGRSRQKVKQLGSPKLTTARRVDAAPPTTSSQTSCANMHVPIRVIEELTSALE